MTSSRFLLLNFAAMACGVSGLQMDNTNNEEFYSAEEVPLLVSKVSNPRDENEDFHGVLIENDKLKKGVLNVVIATHGFGLQKDSLDNLRDTLLYPIPGYDVEFHAHEAQEMGWWNTKAYFLNHASTFSQFAKETIKNYANNNEDKQIHVTLVGYSIGGVAATTAAVDIQKSILNEGFNHNVKFNAIVTLNSPHGKEFFAPGCVGGFKDKIVDSRFGLSGLDNWSFVGDAKLSNHPDLSEFYKIFETVYEAQPWGGAWDWISRILSTPLTLCLGTTTRSKLHVFDILKSQQYFDALDGVKKVAVASVSFSDFKDLDSAEKTFTAHDLSKIHDGMINARAETALVYAQDANIEFVTQQQNDDGVLHILKPVNNEKENELNWTSMFWVTPRVGFYGQKDFFTDKKHRIKGTDALNTDQAFDHDGYGHGMLMGGAFAPYISDVFFG